MAGIGIEPNVELAAEAGLPVDERHRRRRATDASAGARTYSRPAMSPASRVAALGGELRVEHEDHAKSHGRQVGANMAGADEPYEHLPFFYSDLFDLGYEAVGELDSRLETLVRAGTSSTREGTIYYLDARAASARRPALEPLRPASTPRAS